jgi:GDP-L-fucose synthase
MFDLPITLRQRRKFDYIYIKDLPAILESFIFMSSAPPETAYNVTPDAAVDLYEIAERVRTILRKDVPIQVAQDGVGVEYSGDNARLRKLLPGLRLTSLDDAIADLGAWYHERRGEIRREWLLADK